MCVADLFEDKAQVVATDITGAGGSAIAAALDVQRDDAWAEAVAATARALGPVTILCNNAGRRLRGV